MSPRLLIETRGPWAGPGCAAFVRDAAALAARPGTDGRTRLLLLQDGVLAGVPGALPQLTDFLAASGGELLVDRFSAEQRALTDDGRLVDGARLVELAEVVDDVLDPAVQVVWH